jgi:8-oxo-dGTP diphosphatase
MFLPLPPGGLDAMMPMVFNADQELLQNIEDHVFRCASASMKWHAKKPQQLHADLWKSVSARAARLSDAFTSGRQASYEVYLNDPLSLAAYALYFHTANVVRALEVFKHAPYPFANKRKLTFLDVGCGTGAGTQAWAHWVVHHDRTVNMQAHLMDPSATALDFSKKLIETDPTCCRTVAVQTFQTLPDQGQYDAIFVGNVLNELSAEQQSVMIAKLQKMLNKNGLLVVMEPALQEPSRSLMALKETLQTHQLWMLAPCSHHLACPLLLDEKQWCHFHVDWQPTDIRSRLEKNLRHQSGRLSYAFLLASTYKSVHAGRRTLSKVLKTKIKKVSAVLTCMPQRIQTLYFDKKHPQLSAVTKGELIRLSDTQDPPEKISRVTPAHQDARWVDFEAKMEILQPTSPLRVVALILYTADQKIWLGQRRKGDSSEGFWEFPGGKIEPGESPMQALCRELEEELSWNAEKASFFHQFSYRYPTREIHLTFFAQKIDRVVNVSSVAHDQGRWVGLDEIEKYPLLEANQTVLTMIKDRLWI